MRKRKNSKVAMKTLDKEVIVIDTDTDTDTDEVDGRMLALCDEVNASCELLNTLAEDGENNRASMQIVCADGCDSGLVYDLDYKKYLTSCSEYHPYLLEDDVRDSSPLRLMFNVDNETSDRKKSRSVKDEKSRARRKSKSPSISGVTKNGRADHKLVSVKEEKRKAKSQAIFRDSKRLKTENGRADSRTIPMVNTKKKGEALRGRKINVTKNNVESKLFHSFKARKKVNEETLSSVDKSYTYYLARNPITIFEPDQQVNPVKDLVCLSGPDIIAVSDHPFADGDNIPFETYKDDKVIDLEDGIEPDEIFNSSFSKKLIQTLRKPYDEKEFLQLVSKVKHKRPSTRSRQLRDGREIEYNVHHQLRHSYLEQHTDFEKKFRRCKKDRPRALKLLRGFFFYFENIVRVGAFKPWMYEKRLEKMCFDARRCKDAE